MMMNLDHLRKYLGLRVLFLNRKSVQSVVSDRLLLDDDFTMWFVTDLQDKTTSGTDSGREAKSSNHGSSRTQYDKRSRSVQT